MADTLSRLAGPSQVASGTSTIFTVPSAHTYTVKQISLVNQATTPTTVELGINGVTDNKIFFPVSLVSGYGGSVYFETTMIFAATDTMQIQVSQADSITVIVHGLDQG